MSKPENTAGHKRVSFALEQDADGYPPVDAETLWVLPKEDGYEVDNIPFYVRSIACGDLVAAQPDGDGMLCFSGLVRASGNSTIRLLFAREEDVAAVREELRQMGCDSEVSDVSRLVAVDVPPSVKYEGLKAYFEEGERAGRFEYEEGCLGQRK
jgi:hypothetical protein